MRLPEGTVTFLLTDIEGSTRLWELHPDSMRPALVRHDALIAETVHRQGGTVIRSRGEGDSLFAVFARATDAVAAAAAVQRQLHAERWATPTPLRVRIALHTGEADLREGDYYGAAVNRCARLRAIAHGGQVLLSGATQGLVQDHLPEGVSLQDLGEHRLKDLARPERVFQLLHPALPPQFPPLRSLSVLPHNLPQQTTTFVGRQREMSEVRRLLATTSLLTLTGAGGTGKTRLALQVAADLVPEKEDGVWLAELAPLTDPPLVAQAVATALGVREPEGPEREDKPLLQVLVEWLQPKKLLLLLDNCEHLLLACAELADRIIRSCPGVQILATSREGLNVPGETTYRLPSLTAPDPRQPPPTLETVTQYEAVRLFIDRAMAAMPSFAVTNQNAPAVAQVCHRLDGIPLAIELAAARVKVLPVEKISERLDDRFRLLTGGSRTALPRQQTLRALIDWSYDLLPEPERILLRRLSVFAGGWTLEAAETVCAGAGLEEWDVLGLLAQLVEKSLVNNGGESARYRLSETVREYGRDRLLEAGETEVVRAQHARCFLRLAEEADPELHGAQQAQWCERLDKEHDNLRAALAWGRTDGEGGETSLRLAGALWWYWYLRGHFREGQEWLQGALALTASAPRTGMRAKALEGLGGLALFRGDFSTARPLLEESVALWRELEDSRSLAYALRGLGWVMMGLRDHAAALTAAEECLALFRERGDQQGVARSLTLKGHAACATGDDAAARALWEEGLALAREAGDMHMVGWGLYILGVAAEKEKEYETARALWAESLAIRRELGHKPGIAMSLAALAHLSRLQGQAERAARLLGAAAVLHDALGALSLPDWLPNGHLDRESEAAELRAVLGEEAFAAAWAEGCAMELEHAITEALAEPEPA